MVQGITPKVIKHKRKLCQGKGQATDKTGYLITTKSIGKITVSAITTIPIV